MAVPYRSGGGVVMDEPSGAQDLEIDLGDLLAVLWKRRWVWGGMAAVAVLTAALLSYFVLPPVYQAAMTIMVVQASEERRPVSGEQTLEDAVNPLSFLPQMTIKTYEAQLTNPRLLVRVRDRLGLDPKLYGEGVLAGMVKAGQIRDTNLIRVTVEHTDPVLARRFAETLAEEFFTLIEENVNEQLQRSLGLLERQLEVTGREMDAAIARLTEARSRPRSAALVEEEFNTTRELLAAVRAELAEYEVDAAALRDMVAALDAQIEQTPAELEFKETSTAAEGETTTIREEPNPAYQSLVQLRQERAAELARVEAEISVLVTRAAELESAAQRLQAELVQVRAEEQALERKVQQLEKTFALLSEKLAETRALQAGNLAETAALLTAPPVTPEAPVRPRKAMNMAVAAMLGLMLGVMLAFVVEHLDNTVKLPEDIERLIGVPVMGEVPQFGPGRA